MTPIVLLHSKLIFQQALLTGAQWTSGCKLDSLRNKITTRKYCTDSASCVKYSVMSFITLWNTSLSQNLILRLTKNTANIFKEYSTSPLKSRHWSLGLTTLERVHKKNKQLLVWITVYIPLGSGWWTCTQCNTVLPVSLDWPNMFNLARASSAMQDRLYLKRKTKSSCLLELEIRQICFYVSQGISWY